MINDSNLATVKRLCNLFRTDLSTAIQQKKINTFGEITPIYKKDSLISCPSLRPVRLPEMAKQRLGRRHERLLQRRKRHSDKQQVDEMITIVAHSAMIGMIRDNNPIFLVITRTLIIATDWDVRQHHMFPIQIGSNVESLSIMESDYLG